MTLPTWSEVLTTAKTYSDLRAVWITQVDAMKALVVYNPSRTQMDDLVKAGDAVVASFRGLTQIKPSRLKAINSLMDTLFERMEKLHNMIREIEGAEEGSEQ